MTARNGSAEWLGSVESGSGTITVGDVCSKAAGPEPESQRTTARVAPRNLDGDCPVSRALAGISELGMTAKLLTSDPGDVPDPELLQ
jgi:hypothetical protein